MAKSVKPYPLRPGPTQPSPTAQQVSFRTAQLMATVKRYLPEFAESAESDAAFLVLHQDSFAANYDMDEYTLLGMAIKYAGLHGKPVQIIGTNHQTF